MKPTQGLLDTSVFIALEQRRDLDFGLLPTEQFVSSITHGELYAGVYSARSLHTRAIRISTIESLANLVTLPADAAAAAHWGRLRQAVSEAGRKANVNGLWVASTALAHDLTVYTQDADFELLTDLGGPPVVRV